MHLEDEIKSEIYEEVRKANTTLFEENPIEYHRLCNQRYDLEHSRRIEARKK